MNIGLILGKSGLADVDLDCPEARAAWPEFQPAATWTFGRRSAPASHFLFRAEPPVRFSKFMDGRATTMAELRSLTVDGGIGLQSVVPVSTHESGELIEFDLFASPDTPAVVRDYALEVAVRYTGAAALLARHWPGERAGRNDCFLALAGSFAAEEWPKAEALKFARAIYRALWGEEADFRAAELEVENTYSRFDDKREITGWGRLRALVDPKVLRTFATWVKLQPGRWGRGIRVDFEGLQATIESLNALSIWHREIQFQSIQRRGPLLIAETTAGAEVVFPTPAELITFSRAQAIIAEHTGVLILTPARHEVHQQWEPAVSLMLRLANWGATRTEPDLAEEVRELLRMTYERAYSPTVDQKQPELFAELLEMCATRARNPKTDKPPQCAVFSAENCTWVHLPSLQAFLSTPGATGRHWEWTVLKRGLLMLGFTYVKDVHRRSGEKTGQASLWRGPLEVLK
jgi:hypothetical protein